MVSPAGHGPGESSGLPAAHFAVDADTLSPCVVPWRKRQPAAGLCSAVRAVVYLVAMKTGLRRSELNQLRAGRTCFWMSVAPRRAQHLNQVRSGGERGQVMPSPRQLHPLYRSEGEHPRPGGDHQEPQGRLLCRWRPRRGRCGAFDPRTRHATLRLRLQRARASNENVSSRSVPVRASSIQDAAGRRVDFHSLRMVFGTWLAVSGAHPRAGDGTDAAQRSQADDEGLHGCGAAAVGRGRGSVCRRFRCRLLTTHKGDSQRDAQTGAGAGRDAPRSVVVGL